GVVVADADAARRTGLELRDAADLPAAQKLTRQIILIAKQRQLIEEVGDQDMPAVELRRTPEIVGVVGIRDNIALIGAVVHALRERVRRAELDAVRESPVPTDLQRIIHRARD